MFFGCDYLYLWLTEDFFSLKPEKKDLKFGGVKKKL